MVMVSVPVLVSVSVPVLVSVSVPVLVSVLVSASPNNDLMPRYINARSPPDVEVTVSRQGYQQCSCTTTVKLKT